MTGVRPMRSREFRLLTPHRRSAQEPSCHRNSPLYRGLCVRADERPRAVVKAGMRGPNRSHIWIPRVCVSQASFSTPQSPSCQARARGQPCLSRVAPRAPRCGQCGKCSCSLAAQSTPTIYSGSPRGARAPRCDQSEDCASRGRVPKGGA